MYNKNDATTLAINYAYTPYDHLISPDRIKARAKLTERVGEVIGDGGEFHLILKSQEKYDDKIGMIIGRWVCRIEEVL